MRSGLLRKKGVVLSRGLLGGEANWIPSRSLRHVYSKIVLHYSFCTGFLKQNLENPSRVPTTLALIHHTFVLVSIQAHKALVLLLLPLPPPPPPPSSPERMGHLHSRVGSDHCQCARPFQLDLQAGPCD